MSATSFRGHHAPETGTRRAERLLYVKRHAPRYAQTFARAFEGKSLRAGVTAFCIECVGFEAAEVAKCTACCCPLWAVRQGAVGGK